MGRIAANKPAASCHGCFAWGQLPGRFCRACYTDAQRNARGTCVGCRRFIPVDVKHGYCRLCRAQATWAIKASGATGALLAPFLANVSSQQLFFANMQRPRSCGPPVGKPGRHRQVSQSKAVVNPPRVVSDWIQLELFTPARDYDRFDRRRDADMSNPRLTQSRHEARVFGEARGWNKAAAAEVDRALIVLLSRHAEGEQIRFSEMFPALRCRGLCVKFTTEVLDRVGLFFDDRTPTIDLWLQRKLDGVTPSIRSVVEQWARTLFEGGPRSQPRDRRTVWNYLNELQPLLLEWSQEYDDLREVTRQDVLTARDATTGKQREARLVALRSLFAHAKKSGQVFADPTCQIHVPRVTGGVIQPLKQAEINETIAAATKPHTKLIIALAAVHAARTKQMRLMLLDDVDLGNRKITIASHVHPLDDLTRRALLGWLDYRRTRWPNTANPHLLITQQTATGLGPAGRLWTTRATRNLTAMLERLRVDRQLEEALNHGPDPLHLSVVFGISEKTAIRYTATVQQLLQSEVEIHTASSPRTQGSILRNETNQPLGSR